MKKPYSLGKVVPAALVLLAVACSRQPEKLAWQPVSLDRHEGDCSAGPGSACARVELEYPRFEAGADVAVLEAVNGSVRSLLLADPDADSAADAERMAEGFLEEYRRIRRDFPDAASATGWYLERRIAVFHALPGVVCLRCEHESYAGGAHGLQTIDYACFDLSDGHRLTLDELVEPEAGPRLDALAEERFRDTRGLAANMDLVKAGFWVEDGFKVNDNFALSEGGLLFHYNPYEIAPYALGDTEIVVPWADVGPLLRDQGLLTELVP